VHWLTRKTQSLSRSANSNLLKRYAASKTKFAEVNQTAADLFYREAIVSYHHLHKKLRDDLQLPNDCVIHSLRHTFLTRFGEAGADAFTIKKVAGHSSVTISERYIHPTPEGQERAFERFANLNQEAIEKVGKDRESLQIPLH